MCILLQIDIYVFGFKQKPLDIQNMQAAKPKFVHQVASTGVGPLWNDAKHREDSDRQAQELCVLGATSFVLHTLSRSSGGPGDVIETL